MQLTETQTICDPFTIYTTGGTDEKAGVITFGGESRITGEKAFWSIDPYAEMFAQAIKPEKAALLLNMLTTSGFRVSTDAALPRFFHALLFPEDCGIKVKELPKNAKVTHISSLKGLNP